MRQYCSYRLVKPGCSPCTCDDYEAKLKRILSRKNISYLFILISVVKKNDISKLATSLR